jgi:large subunit ribosomal protein L35
MPKVKTHRGAAKRFKVTGSGKIMYKAVGNRHNLGNMKTRTQKASYAIDKELFAGDVPNVAQMLKLKTSRAKGAPYVRKDIPALQG